MANENDGSLTGNGTFRHDAVIDPNMNEFSRCLYSSIVTEYSVTVYIRRFNHFGHHAALYEATSDSMKEAPAGFRVTFTGSMTTPEVAIAFAGE